MTENHQQGITEPAPRLARYMILSLRPDTEPRQSLKDLAGVVDGSNCVVGIGESLLKYLGADIPGMHSFPAHSVAGIDVPSTPAAIWCWIRGEDRGELVHASRTIESLLSPDFELVKIIDAFQYRDSRDLSGYEDGTENPKGNDALAAALMTGQAEGLDGSSLVAVQQWLHDLDYVDSMEDEERDHMIGRRLSDNEEIEDAPESAHVKRTAQEDFEPEAFVLRRSMPWADESGEGLVFVAFGKSFDAFEALLNRMLGKDDGIVDAIFRMSQAISGNYFWCPPVKDGQLDLRALKL
ncbi:MAG: Dyp-type peroxidase [Gammaproteobacteria bacterium]|nr:Dyp-type peroxidase [Gammaproteobacteria bacterium]